ncbi:MAG: hypothetical protein ABFD90_06435 [Phycisphaerales bacterium]
MGEVQYIEIAQRLIRVLDTLDIPYAIGGSMASSLYGMRRFTQDADIVVKPFLPIADKFFNAVKGEFERQLLVRSRRVKLTDTAQSEVCVVSPEDIILLKLRWLQETGGTSEHQWRDVLGVQGEGLDYEYLADWAKKLGLNELLDRAIAEVRT